MKKLLPYIDRDGSIWDEPALHLPRKEAERVALEWQASEFNGNDIEIEPTPQGWKVVIIRKEEK